MNITFLPNVHSKRLCSLACSHGVPSQLVKIFETSKKLLVVTGAGVSTESGIPDYRSPGRPPYRPLQHSEFVKQESVRRRYWARSMIGFTKIISADPNAAHLALAQLEKFGIVKSLITQNVDRLHQKAGHQRVLELHGTIHEVECMNCGHSLSRVSMQDELTKRNVDWINKYNSKHFERPDGDAELPTQVAYLAVYDV